MFQRRVLIGLAVMALAIAVGAMASAGPVGAGGGGGCREPVTDGRGTSVDLKGNCMITTILRIRSGDTVTFTNRDEVDHTVTGAGVRSGGASLFGSFEPLAPNDTYAHRFDASGVYLYYCAFHPGMVGAIVVGDGNGPASATGEGVAPLGVTLRNGAGGAQAGDAVSAGTSTGRFGAGWMVILGGGAVSAVTAALFMLRLRPWGGLRRVES
jgi:plastocyanin